MPFELIEPVQLYESQFKVFAAKILQMWANYAPERAGINIGDEFPIRKRKSRQPLLRKFSQININT